LGAGADCAVSLRNVQGAGQTPMDGLSKRRREDVTGDGTLKRDGTTSGQYITTARRRTKWTLSTD